MDRHIKITRRRILIIFYCSIIFTYFVLGFFRCYYHELATFLSNIGITYLRLTFWVFFSTFFLLLLLMLVDLTYNERFHFIIIVYLALYGILFMPFIFLLFTDSWFFILQDLLYYLNDVFLPIIFLDLYLFMMYEHRKLINYKDER